MGRKAKGKKVENGSGDAGDEQAHALFPGFTGKVEAPVDTGAAEEPADDVAVEDSAATRGAAASEAVAAGKAEKDAVDKAEEERLAAEATAKADEDRVAAAEASAEAAKCKQAAEAAAKAEEDRLAAEAAAKAEEDRRAAEAAAKAKEDFWAKEAAAKAEEDRLAAEVAAKAKEDRLAADADAKAAAKVEADRGTAEVAAKAEEDRVAAQAAAKAQADHLAAEAAAKAAAAASMATAETALRKTSDASNSDAASTPWAAAEKRLRELLPNVKDTSVLQELANLPDSDALERLVQKGKPPPKANFAAPPRKLSANVFAANDTMAKSHASQEAAKGLAKNLGTVDSKSLAVGGAGQGGGLGLNKPGFGPKVQHFAGGGGRASLTGAKSITIEPEVPFAWSEMMDDKSSTGWVIASYAEDGKTLKLHAKGEGGINAFKTNLPEGIAWGGFRCAAVDKRGGLDCKRTKFVFVCYKPEVASAMKKAKQASHKGDVKEAFQGAHVDVIVETMADLEEENLITKLQAATGAHKPNGYEFEEGDFKEADFYGLGIGKSCKGESSKN